MTFKILLLVPIILVSVIFLQGCTGGQLLSAISITSAKCVARDLIYEPNKTLATDIYYTKNDQNTTNTAALSHCLGEALEQNDSVLMHAPEVKPPTLIFIFGGGWQKGDKAEYGFVADAFVKQGYNVLIPNYRLYPEAAYPSYIEELAIFMQWFAKNADALGLSKTQVHLMGHSAGAYNIAMYLLDNKYKKPINIDAFIGLAGPYDYFLPTKDPKYINIFTKNGEFNQPAYMPANQKPSQLSSYLNRALLVHGDKDTTVTPKNLDSFSQYFKSHEIPVTVNLVKGMGHVGVVANLNNVPFVKSKIRQDIFRFLKQPL